MRYREDFPKSWTLSRSGKAAAHIGAGFEELRALFVRDGGPLSSDTGATRSAFLMNSSTGLLTQKHILMEKYLNMQRW